MFYTCVFTSFLYGIAEYFSSNQPRITCNFGMHTNAFLSSNVCVCNPMHEHTHFTSTLTTALEILHVYTHNYTKDTARVQFIIYLICTHSNHSVLNIQPRRHG